VGAVVDEFHIAMAAGPLDYFVSGLKLYG